METKEKIPVVIDRSKWITGKGGVHETGEGATYLLNAKGFQCCLGFICEAAGIAREKLLDVSSPGCLAIRIPALTLISERSGAGYNTALVTSAIDINDAQGTTPQQKEERLLELFKDSPYQLSFTGEYTTCEC